MALAVALAVCVMLWPKNLQAETVHRALQAQLPTWAPLDGRSLKVVYIQYQKDAFKLPSGRWRGIYPDLYDEVIRNLGVTKEEVPLSNESLQAFPTSQWTACAYQVATGFADLCISSFWVTPERRQMVDFVTPSFRDDIKLFVSTASTIIRDDGFLHSIQQILAPFHWSVWVFLVGSLILIAVVSSVLDRMARIFGASDSQTSGREHRPNAMITVSSMRQSLSTPTVKRASSFFGTVSDTFVSLISYDYERVRHQRSIIKFSRTVLVLVATSCYTASLAAHMTIGYRTVYERQYNSLDEINRDGKAVCSLGGLKSLAEDNQPNAQVIGHATWDDVKKAHSEGECVGMLSMSAPGRTPLVTDCDYMQVGEPLASLSVSQPVARDIQPAISLEVTRLFVSGRVQTLRNMYTSLETCSFEEGTTDDNTVDFLKLSGLFFLLLILLVCGAFYWFVRYVVECLYRSWYPEVALDLEDACEESLSKNGECPEVIGNAIQDPYEELSLHPVEVDKGISCPDCNKSDVAPGDLEGQAKGAVKSSDKQSSFIVL